MSIHVLSKVYIMISLYIGEEISYEHVDKTKISH